jgi:hypothetical protein
MARKVDYYNMGHAYKPFPLLSLDMKSLLFFVFPSGDLHVHLADGGFL